jgi:hypothetical protein
MDESDKYLAENMSGKTDPKKALKKASQNLAKASKAHAKQSKQLAQASKMHASDSKIVGKVAKKMKKGNPHGYKVSSSY